MFLAVKCALAKIFLLHLQFSYSVIHNKCDTVFNHNIKTKCTQYVQFVLILWLIKDVHSKKKLQDSKLWLMIVNFSVY